MKFFFASLVGMLRDKQESIRELSTAVQGALAERLRVKLAQRVEEQEDELYRLKDVSLYDVLHVILASNLLTCSVYCQSTIVSIV